MLGRGRCCWSAGPGKTSQQTNTDDVTWMYMTQTINILLETHCGDEVYLVLLCDETLYSSFFLMICWATLAVRHATPPPPPPSSCDLFRFISLVSPSTIRGHCYRRSMLTLGRHQRRHACCFQTAPTSPFSLPTPPQSSLTDREGEEVHICKITMITGKNEAL